MDKSVLFWSLYIAYLGSVIVKWLTCFFLKRQLNYFKETLVVMVTFGIIVFNEYEGFQALLLMGVVTILITIYIIDLKTMIIPDTLNLSIILIGIVQIFINTTLWKNRLISGIILITFLAVIVIIEKIMKREIIGGGDLKLLVSLGIVSGLMMVLQMLLISSILGIICEEIKQRGREKKEAFAFGPYLVVGWIVVNIIKVVII